MTAVGGFSNEKNGQTSFLTSWEIPNVWRVVRDEAGTNEFVRTEQRFELDSDGTARVFKFGFMGVRGTNDVCNVIERP